MSQLKPDQQGYIVLVTVIVLGGIVSIIAGILLITGQNASISSNTVVANANTKAAAKACAQLALSNIQSTSNLVTPITVNQVVNTTNKQNCSYTITGSNPNYTIVATGTVTQGANSYVHRLTITTNQTIPQINVSSWQDTP